MKRPWQTLERACDLGTETDRVLAKRGGLSEPMVRLWRVRLGISGKEHTMAATWSETQAVLERAEREQR